MNSLLNEERWDQIKNNPLEVVKELDNFSKYLNENAVPFSHRDVGSNKCVFLCEREIYDRYKKIYKFLQEDGENSYSKYLGYIFSYDLIEKI
jgi:hypothetical protein